MEQDNFEKLLDLRINQRNPDAFAQPRIRDRELLTDLHETLEARLNAPPLTFIAEALLKLTYIDMVNLGEGIKVDPRAVYDWAKGYLEPTNE